MSASGEATTEPAMGLLDLPSELVSEILSNFDPVDILSFGQTSHWAKNQVNEHATVLSEAKIQRERTRLLEDRTPRFEGVSLVQAIRSWALHYGGIRKSHLFVVSLNITRRYTDGNQLDFILGPGRQDGMLFMRLVEYLIHLNYVYHCGVSNFGVTHMDGTTEVELQRRPCICLTCKGQWNAAKADCCWVEQEVREFGRTGWTSELTPLRFWDHVTTPASKELVNAKQWTEMVRDIMSWPIEDPSDFDRIEGSAAVMASVEAGLGIERDSRLTEAALIEMTGLPQLGDEECYIPRTDMAKRRRTQCRGETVCMWKTRGARAIEEFARRTRGSLRREETLLDPKSLLLRTVVFEELHLVHELVRRPF